MTQSKFIRLINEAFDKLGNVPVIIYHDYWKRGVNILNGEKDEPVVRSTLMLETVKDLATKGLMTPTTMIAGSFSARKLVTDTNGYPFILSCEYEDSEKEWNEAIEKFVNESKSYGSDR